uniref:Leucine-rich repeat-containing protein 23 n=1 Tax=Malurus cyaneus samueli TaxID=2593467 RepID=A0A8C5TY20_9PASS
MSPGWECGVASHRPGEVGTHSALRAPGKRCRGQRRARPSGGSAPRPDSRARPRSHGSGRASPSGRAGAAAGACTGRMDDEELEDEREEEDEKEDDEEKEEKEEVRGRPSEPVPCPLTEEILQEGLSLLSKTGNGLRHAYVKFEAKEKGLTDISLLERFIHLRYVDLSNNKLRDLSPLSSLTQLLWLKVDGNLLTSARMQELPYLQVMSFDRNNIMDLEGITHPLLTNLSLKENKIETVLGLSHDQLFSLKVLELRGNKLKTTAGLGVFKLKKLFLLCSLGDKGR